MATIFANLQAVKSRLYEAARAAGRNPDDIKLVAVGKSWPAAALREAFLAGQRTFGESYVQEAVAKMRELVDLDIEWHFIGPVQGNKTKLIAENFAWVHSIDRARIAQRLSAARPAALPPLKLCLQLNLSQEASKSGVSLEAAGDLARSVAGLPRLELRGLMTIPEPDCAPHRLRERFAGLRRLRDDLNGYGFALDTLSMGMSADLEAAVAEGATMVRIGSAIFGPRAARPPEAHA